MRKKTIFILSIFAVLLSGCETIKGTVKGIAYGVSTATDAIVDGVKKDTVEAANFIKASDNWIKENLW